MSESSRYHRYWLLPFVVSVGMGVGSLLGFAGISNTGQEGPAGDQAGAAGALLLILVTAGSFVTALVAVIVTRIFRRGQADFIALRLVGSVIGGAITSVAAMSSVEVVRSNSWIALLGFSVLLVWSRQRKPDSEEDADAA